MGRRPPRCARLRTRRRRLCPLPAPDVVVLSRKGDSRGESGRGMSSRYRQVESGQSTVPAAALPAPVLQRPLRRVSSRRRQAVAVRGRRRHDQCRRPDQMPGRRRVQPECDQGALQFTKAELALPVGAESAEQHVLEADVVGRVREPRAARRMWVHVRRGFRAGGNGLESRPVVVHRRFKVPTDRCGGQNSAAPASIPGISCTKVHAMRRTRGPGPG